MGQRIVITGAAGNVGRTVTAALEGRHSLTLMDWKARADREVIRVNLGDFAAVLDRMPEADTVIHLGANAGEAEWQDILTNNIIATYNVFEIARRKGAKRIVFTSTVMTYDGFHGRLEDTILTPEQHVWPMTYYAVSKHFGEDLGKMYARTYGIGVVCIRLGWYPRPPIDQERVRQSRVIVLGEGDCKRLFTRAVEAEEVEFAAVNGFSVEGAARYDLEPGRRLIGYEPQDDFETAFAALAAREPW